MLETIEQIKRRLIIRSLTRELRGLMYQAEKENFEVNYTLYELSRIADDLRVFSKTSHFI